MIKLRNKDAALDLAPEYGGSVIRFSIAGRDILRPYTGPKSDGIWDARETAAFPMFPFSGRIHDGKFSYNDEHYQRDANMPPEPHAIHGTGWQSEWNTGIVSAHSASLYHEAQENWPSSYRAEQHFELFQDRLELTLSLTNTGAASMPAGMGWHPYFLRKEARLYAPTSAIWSQKEPNDATKPEPVPMKLKMNSETIVDTLLVDNAFDMAGNTQTLTYPDFKLTMTSSSIFEKLVIFVPPNEDFFCVEPATHAPDAINSDLSDKRTGLKHLQPGRLITGKITLTVST